MADIKASAVITAAGLGKRFEGKGDKLPKQFIPLSGTEVIAHSIKAFENSDFISEIIVVVPENFVSHTQTEVVSKHGFKKVTCVITGGNERQDSVMIGINAITDKPDVVVVHDGVRPLVKTSQVEEVIEEAIKAGGAILAVPATDTIKKSGTENTIEATLSREEIWFAQTPQAFKYDIITEALEKAALDNYLGTDEAELVERTGEKVKLVPSSKENIKITTAEDIELAELILKSRINRKQ